MGRGAAAKAAPASGKKIEKKVTLVVSREEKKKGGEQFSAKTLVLDWDDNPVWKFTREVPYAPSSPTAIAELGIAYSDHGHSEQHRFELDRRQQPACVFSSSPAGAHHG